MCHVLEKNSGSFHADDEEGQYSYYLDQQRREVDHEPNGQP